MYLHSITTVIISLGLPSFVDHLLGAQSHTVHPRRARHSLEQTYRRISLWKTMSGSSLYPHRSKTPRWNRIEKTLKGMSPRESFRLAVCCHA